MDHHSHIAARRQLRSDAGAECKGQVVESRQPVPSKGLLELSELDLEVPKVAHVEVQILPARIAVGQFGLRFVFKMLKEVSLDPDAALLEFKRRLSDGIP
jgi:hypothetical protein